MIDNLKDYFGLFFGSGHPFHSLALFEGIHSLNVPLTEQRDTIIKYLVDHADELNITGGFNFVGHSQGALLARAVIQALPPTLNVSTYVSLGEAHIHSSRYTLA